MLQPPTPLDDLSRLGLAPGAPLDALKPAWRRAVSALHPDRRGPQADRELAEVNAAFQRLQAFARQHGRLPSRLEPRVGARTSDRRGRRHWALAALSVAAALVVLWPQARRPESGHGTPGAAIAFPTAEAPASMPEPLRLGAATDHLDVGIDMAEAERIAGPPVFRSAERWEYGPSEIRFVDGKVTGWYSSPLRPLPVDDTRRSPVAHGD